MTSDDIVKIGEEMVRVIEPVYKQLDKIESTQNEHTNKIDALIADMVQLQDEIGVIKDDYKNIKRELKNFNDHNQKEHDEIKKYVRMQL